MLSFLGGILGSWLAKVSTFLITLFGAEHFGRVKQHAEDLEEAHKEDVEAQKTADTINQLHGSALDDELRKSLSDS